MSNKQNKTPDISPILEGTEPLPRSEYELVMLLHDGSSVPGDLYNRVQKQVEEVLPAMQRDQGYKLKNLCGSEFWKTLNKGEPQIAGRCMVDMVIRNKLPLNFAGSNSENHKLYKLK